MFGFGLPLEAEPTVYVRGARGKKDVGKTFKSKNHELLDSLQIEKSRHDGVHLHTIGQRSGRGITTHEITTGTKPVEPCGHS